MSPVYVTDVATAVVCVLDDPESIGPTITLGGPEILSWSTMLRRIAATVGRKKWIVPMPIAVMRIAATLLDRLPMFPVTRDQLTMLAEGNSASPDPLASILGRSPVPFNEETLSYLNRNTS